MIGGLAALFAGKRKPPVTPAPAATLVGGVDPERVASACAIATEAEGRRSFAIAQVGTVGAVTPEPSGYAVSGEVLLRNGWRNDAQRRAFRCAVDAQAVRSVSIEGPDRIAAAVGD